MKFTQRLMESKPAKDWNEAYPLGNGSFGVMVDGGIKENNYYFNDDSFWAGTGQIPCKENNLMKEIKELAMNKDYTKASFKLWKEVYGEYPESYLPLARLQVLRSRIEDSPIYCRMLDIQDALSQVSIGEHNYEECFTSHPDQLFCLRMVTDKDTNYEFKLDSQVYYDKTVEINGQTACVKMNIVGPSHLDPIGHQKGSQDQYIKDAKGIRSFLKFYIKTSGKIRNNTDNLVVYDAGYIEVAIAEATNKQHENYYEVVSERIDKFIKNGYDAIRTKHIEDFHNLYNRCSLNIGEPEYAINEFLPTSFVLKHLHFHPDVSTLMFNYARYLMISASREDSKCMNLQGLWNAKLQPPWSSAYTVNINIEMNYWIAEMCNLSECHMPLFNHLKVIEKSGRITAKKQLDSEGWVCGHNSDIWGHTNLTGGPSTFDPTQYALYISGGAWLATHIFTHYEYTKDKAFLNEYYYILKGCAEFYLSYLMKDNESDYLVLCPGASPENSFKYNKQQCSLSKNSTMDSSIARHIFRIIIESAKILDTDKEFADKCQEAMDKLYPFKIGAKGELMEWYENYPELEMHHRHLSHLYGLHPDNQITPEKTPELAEACYKTLKRRGKKGIGWSLAWKINMLARLKKGNEAIKVINQKTKYYNPKHKNLNYGGCYTNLFCAPPMQVDGNFGLASGICEMLLQSHDGIELLPALPYVWGDGSFTGLKAKGGYEVSCKWKDGSVTSFMIKGEGETIDVKVNDEIKNVPLNEEITL